MIPTIPRRGTLRGAARLAVTVPFVGTGMAVMVASLTVWGLLGTATAAGLGIAVVGLVADLLSTTPPFWAYLAGAVAFAVAGLRVWTDRAWATVRDGLRVEPAAMLARTREPNEADPGETRAVETLSWLCQAVDLPVPALRLRETERALCYTVRYPVDDPPREVLMADVDRFRKWNVRKGDRDGRYDDDRPITADHAVVLSTGLVEALPPAELRAVLAHEVAHLRNGDPRLMNVALLPAFWAESVAGFEDCHDPSDYVLAAERWVRANLARAVSMLGVAFFARGREYAADDGGAELTGDPAALASALERLGTDVGERPSTDLRAVGVTNVLPTTTERSAGIPASHPPTDRRIERLRHRVE